MVDDETNLRLWGRWECLPALLIAQGLFACSASRVYAQPLFRGIAHNACGGAQEGIVDAPRGHIRAYEPQESVISMGR